MVTDVLDLPGLHVVRPLSRSHEREVVLAHLAAENGDEAGTEARATVPVVVIRARDAAGAAGARRELEALDRAQGPGVVELLDVASDAWAPAVLLSRLPGRTLAAVLADRTTLSAGEAVALLAPLATAVARLHDGGVAHGRIHPERIRGVDPPVLVGFRHATCFPAGAPEVVRAGVPGVAADRAALRELAGAVLGRVAGGRERAASDLLARLATLEPASVAPALVAGLSELAAASPVRERDLEPRPPSQEPGAGEPARIVPVDRDARPAGEARDGHGSPLDPFLALAELESVAPRIRDGVDRARALLADLSSRRRRMLVAAGAAVVVASVLLAVVPPDAPADDPPAEAAAGPNAEPPTSDGEAAPSYAVPVGAEAYAITGDDPVAAVVALLEAREACFRELSLLCLEQVDQAGSAALLDDRAAIGALRAGAAAEWPSAALEPAPRVVESLGATVLLELGPHDEPTSVLLMRSEAGWRIRDWIGPQRAAPPTP